MLLGSRPKFDQPTSGELSALCIRGDYTPFVASLLTSTERDKLTESVLAKLRPLSLVQLETVIRAILENDVWMRRHHRRGFTPSTSLAASVRRDGVT